MPRALTIKRTVVPLPERKRYFDRLRLRRDHYQRASCTFSVFEEAALPCAFVELTVAADAATLTAAHANAPDPVFDAGRVYREVEIG